MSIDKFLEKLEEMKQKHGGECSVYLSDDEYVSIIKLDEEGIPFSVDGFNAEY